MKKILLGILAALTTPEAIKAEKSLAAIVLVRAAILIPAAAGSIALVLKLIAG